MMGIPGVKIGPVSTAWLREIGIESADDLKRIGIVEAYRQIKALHPREVSLNLLYGLEAALVGIHWSKHLVGADRHRCEEQHAVGFTLAVQQHDAIEQAVGALLRRHL